MDGLEDAQMVMLFNRNDLKETFSMEYFREYLARVDGKAFCSCVLTGENARGRSGPDGGKLTAKLRTEGFKLG
jgi:hypothetical protein